MSSVMDAARMVADLGIDNRNEVYAPNADAKGNIAPINPAEEQAKRDGALQHRAAARSTGSAQIAGWYSKSSPSLCPIKLPLLTLHRPGQLRGPLRWH